MSNEGWEKKGCQAIESAHVMPGWGCCRCQTYNGGHRRVCKNCGHARCLPEEKTEECPCCREASQPGEKECLAMGDGFLCTLRKGHLGSEHIAHGAGPGHPDHICHRWHQTAEEQEKK